LTGYILWGWLIGGHNLLLLAQDVGQYLQLGTTVDDAIGEVICVSVPHAFPRDVKRRGLEK
jgi:hypothetical protein